MPETLILWRKRETEILAQGNFMFSVNLEVRYQSERWQFYQNDKWQQRREKKLTLKNNNPKIYGLGTGLTGPSLNEMGVT